MEVPVVIAGCVLGAAAWWHMRRGGDESHVDFERWNADPAVTSAHNCYAYALNDRSKKLTDECGARLKAGEVSCLALRPKLGHYKDDNPPAMKMSCDTVRLRARMDNPTLTDATRDAPCPDTHYKIAYAVNPGKGWGSYHWYRQEPGGGRWSHKDGGHKATHLDASGRRIRDPADADRGQYRRFCGYMCAPKNSHADTNMDTWI